MINFKFRNEKPLGDMFFPPTVYVEFNVDAPIEKPFYPIQEEAEEDQEGDIHKLFQRYEKQYRISFKAIESLCDACSIMPLMDEVFINNVRAYDVNVDIAWDEVFECLADVVITYYTKKIIKTL